ncbi:MAG: 2-amino-4-hydroxy-6-hydroxymethyldihydropteridine diphosphokinase [Alphaproteobacteria bacterium]|nr:2-amino-4-hydroxy-6-hydroxymethyldihydropteridine diphosphokinase [Alphaproteobacteria bacterium]
MILVGLGSNLESAEFGTPVEVLGAALKNIERAGVRLLGCSPWYRSAPVPASDQPWFVNGVARFETALAPQALLALLHRVEARLGRRRGARWAARIIDLDLLAYDESIIVGQGRNGLVLPHPRLHERAFVLAPLADLVPSWRHPVSGKSAAELLSALGGGQQLQKITD